MRPEDTLESSSLCVIFNKGEGGQGSGISKEK